MIALIDPAALPALRIAGALFLIIYLLAGGLFLTTVLVVLWVGLWID